MSFYIKSGSSFIRRDSKGKFSKTNNILFADEFDNYWIAKRIIENCISPRERKSCYIIERKDNSVEREKKPTVEPMMQIESESFSLDNLEQKIDEIGKLVEERQQRMQTLCDRLSEIDQEISDIQHYIEINDVEDDEAYKVFHMLQNKLRDRRKIKDEIRIIKSIGECNIDQSLLDPLRLVVSQIKNQKYVPRRLSELFSQKENETNEQTG